MSKDNFDVYAWKRKTLNENTAGKAIDDAIASVDEDMNVEVFAEGIAWVLKDQYGQYDSENGKRNFDKFVEVLKRSFQSLDEVNEASLDSLYAKISAAQEKQMNSPESAALALIGNVVGNLADENNLTVNDKSDWINSNANKVVDRLQKAITGKFKYYGELLDIDYPALKRALETSEFRGANNLPQDMNPLKAAIKKA